MMARAEATLVHQADRDLPELSLVGEGVRLLAEVAERTVLTADDLNEPAGQVRIALSVLALLTLRGACTVVLLLEPGYVPEAGVILNRMTSAVELARLIDRDDEEATVAERFIAGAGLDELEPETWANIAEAVAVNIEQLPQLGLIHTPLGPRPGLGFAGSREPTRAKELAVDAASLLVDMTVLCGATLLGGTAPELLAQRLITLRAEVAREMHSPISGRGDSAHDAEASASSDDGSASTSRAGNS
jgi:hypothetical protein